MCQKGSHTLYSQELTIDGDGTVQGSFTTKELNHLLPFAQAFRSKPFELLRFIFQQTDWYLVEFEKVGDLKNCVVKVQYKSIEPPNGITSRELDVLTLVTLGFSNHGIAARLGNSARTVSTQVEALLQKMNQKSRTALAALAVEHGYIRLPIPGGAIPSLSVPSHVQIQNKVYEVPESEIIVAPPWRLRRQPIQIGLVVPGGEAKSDGQELLKGAQLAVEEANELLQQGSNRRIELVPCTADLFQRLSVEDAFSTLLQENLDAVVTSYAATEDLQVLEQVADSDIPFLHTATQYAQLERVAQDPTRYGNFFQTCPPETYYGKEFIDVLTQLTQTGKWKPANQSFVSVEIDSASTNITTLDLIDYAEKRDWNLATHIKVNHEGVNWSAVIRRIEREDPAVVILTHFLPNELISFYREFLRSGLKSLLMSIYGSSILQFQNEFGGQADGILWSTTSGTYPDLIGNRFRSRYQKRFGKFPGWSQAGAAYDQVNILTRAWQSSNTTKPRAVLQSIRREAFRGVNGTYFLGGEGQTSLAYPYVTHDPSMGQAHMVYQIRNENSYPVGPYPFGNIDSFQLPQWCK